ncbi:MAG: ATP-binding protein [Chlorobium sp.]|nr:ATP-binding protein [Chlorobium sp.]
MRKASIRDCWDNLKKVANAAQGIVRLDQLGQGGLIQSIKPDGLFAVVGANGAGKSSFFEFLSNRDYKRLAFLGHQVELSNGKVLNMPGDRVLATLIEPYAELGKSNNLLVQFKSTYEQEGLSQIVEKERDLINYVLGSSYEQMLIEEVIVENGEACPRFVLSLGGQEFDNESLSLGEQLVLYLYWLLGRKYKSPGIYFVEEPETGLSPVSQQRVVDLLAYLSAKMGKQLFVSTHSPFIVAALGTERVIVMKKPDHAEWTNANDCNHFDELGMELGKKGIFFLEDNKAKVFFEWLLDLYGSSLRKTFDTIFLGGESNVYEVVNRIGEKYRSLKLIGVIDADQKENTRYNESAGNFVFLPGTLSPEEEMIAAVKTHAACYARALGVPLSRLTDAIRLCQGYEHHDFFEELSRKLYGEVKLNVYHGTFGVWYAHFQNKQEISLLIKSLDPNLSEENILAAEMLYGSL